MYKLAIGIGFSLLLFCDTAMAACSVPNTLTNGTTADATAVMGNFTSLAGCAAPLASPSFTGNVGIGTGSPAYALDVQSTTTTSLIRNKSTAGGAVLYLDGSSYASVYNLIGGTTYWASGMTGNGVANSYNWYSYPASAVAFQILTNGNAIVSGCLTYNGGTLGTCLSDARAKKNVAPFRAGLQEIAGLSPVTYEYNGSGDTQADGKVRTGLIAQDVLAAAPALVQTNEAKQTKGKTGDKPLLAVKYGDLTFALINAVKELKAANDNQAIEVEQLKGQIAVLQRKLGVQTAQR